MPERFGAISKGLYYYENETDEDVCLDYSNNYNREIGKKCGFVSPFGASAYSDFAYADWASFVAWILTEDKTEREAGKIRSGHTVLPAILPAGSGTDCKTMSEINC